LPLPCLLNVTPKSTVRRSGLLEWINVSRLKDVRSVGTNPAGAAMPYS
jgi:hypothetical protein